MKTKELIEKLRKLDPDGTKEVLTGHEEWAYSVGRTFTANVEQGVIHEEGGPGENCIIIKSLT